MYTELHCVALRTVRHSDRDSILSAYSLELGRVSFVVPAGQGREAARRRALLMPLARFDCQADVRSGRDIMAMRDVRCVVPAPSGHPAKALEAMFLADFLNALLREPLPDPALFAFVDDAARRLATASKGVANFHICFLLRAARFLGVEPDVSTFRTGMVFDMRGGEFRATPPLDGPFLDSLEAQAAASLLRMTFENMHVFRMSRTDRLAIIDKALAYYAIHFPSIRQLSSLSILRSLL